MKSKLLLILTIFLAVATKMQADDFVNLTPRPKSMTTTAGSLTLPTEFAISCSGIDEEMKAEVNRFAALLKEVAGMNISVAENADNALFNIEPAAESTKEGGYSLIINSKGVTIKAREVLGMYYALQSVKKILPANVMAGVKDAKITAYTLPYCTIVDEPRFAYRGFMLDVSRHFFTTAEVKRMLDVMSYYKLNKFHWHLSDDQGWRAEIKKYPKLTTVAATAPNCRFTDMDECTQYWINKPYGPYFYTQEEMKDVVAYAAERHIEVIPEIDMPGHFCAALTAYPEFSCSPEGAHSVQIDGGIYNDVLNVANPQAVQFTKDVLAELMAIFPSKTIHIGGDECPTAVWESNDDCKALYNKLSLSSYRELQTYFIKELSDFVKEQGRTLSVWNEAITATGADLDLMKETGATVYCWTGADAAVSQSATLGLPSIYTPFGPYYINRRQGSSTQDPPGAGDGTDNVKRTYNTVPPTGTSYGVQGTFWTEHVSDADYMEWLALPRLLAIAEAGWTPQSRKDFSDFQKRMAADTTLLNYGGYRYCTYFMNDDEGSDTPSKVMPHANKGDNKYYYRIISGATAAPRKDRCIELLTASSSLVSEYSAKGAKAGVLWTNAQAADGDENYEYQWWSIEEDPANAGHYALVCKALPDGSVNPTPTATSTSGRWNYDNSTKHYAFQLGTGAYGTVENNYYYSIASDNTSNLYMNSSMAGQGLAVNLYSQPTDGAGGQWQFQPFEDYDGGSVTPEPTFTPLEEGCTYVFTNAIEGYNETSISDNGESTALRHSTDAFVNNAWTVESSSMADDGTQTLKLRNAVTGRYIGTTSSYVDKTGYPVSLTTSGSALTLKFVSDHADFRLVTNSKSLFPLPSGLVYAGATVKGASYDAARMQGAEWNVQKVRVIAFVCTDTEGNSLGTLHRSVPYDLTEVNKELLPSFKNTEISSFEQTDENTVNVAYQRIAHSVVVRSISTTGAIIDETEMNVPVGESLTVTYPEQKYFTLASAEVAEGSTVQPTDDMTLTATYTTDAYIGVKKAGNTVTQLENGKSYLFYDASSDAARVGYRRILNTTKLINRSFSAENLNPSAVWTLEGSDKTFKVKNDYYNLYVPALKRSTATTAAESGESFTFTLNADGETWNIKGTNGQYWDGVENGNLVGWDQGTGHPIRISQFFAQPYFAVHFTCRDAEGNLLQESESLIAAGEAYSLILPTIENYTLTSVSGDENLGETIESHLNIIATYKSTESGIAEAVSESDKTDHASSIYDLQGRRIPQITAPGIYIIGKRKVIIR